MDRALSGATTSGQSGSVSDDMLQQQEASMCV